MKAQFYYCRKCSKPVVEATEKNSVGTEGPFLRNFMDNKTNDLVIARKLVCGHFIPARNPLIPQIREDEAPKFTPTVGELFPNRELDSIRSEVMQSILSMTEEELLAHIQQHHLDYITHLKAQLKEKYTVQLITDELERRRDSGKMSDQLKIDYDYLFRKTGRNQEKVARDVVKAESQAKKKKDSEDSALRQMVEAMNKKGKNITLEQLKAKLQAAQ